MRIFKIAVSHISIVFVLLSGCSKQDNDKLYQAHGNTMGTTYSIKIVKGIDGENQDLLIDLQRKIDSILVVVNQQMSTYIDSSEISRFNRHQAGMWFDVSQNLAFVISKANEISRKSGSAFDITIGPLVNLWGFGPILKVYNIPGDEEIKKAREFVDYKKVLVKMNPASVMKTIPEIYCDLSAIAKGYGVDVVAEFIESLDYANYLVEIGGEVRTRGVNHNNKPWQIGISTPDSQFGIEKVVSLGGASMATSGDYRNYFEKDGVRYSHTLDPRTGYPITHRLVSVTVIHDSCVVADAFATAINVLGPEEGYKLALKEKLPVFLIIRSDDTFIEKMTPEFQEILNMMEK